MTILLTSLRKVEPQTGTDLPRSGIEIEAADSSQHQRPAIEHAQHLRARSLHGCRPNPWTVGEPLRPTLSKMHRSSCEQFMQRRGQSCIPPGPAVEIPGRPHLNLVAGFNPCSQGNHQRWCNCLQPGPNDQVVQNMMAEADRSGWCRAGESGRR